ncbi:MAG: iron ABC transporter substrate-binding protein [Chloroflexi bacterium]|nr:iron ABC transporter substrate-binding protein [Chloroflexota bacterium]
MRTLFRKLLLSVALVLLAAVAIACQPQVVEVPVEVEVTRIVTETETVTETVVEEVQVEVEVTRVVEVEVEVAADPIPADPGSLVIYSGRSESLIAPVIAQFSEATGIQVDVRYGSTAEMAATLFEEGNNSPADVYFAQDPGGLGAISAAGLLAPLPAELLANVPARFQGKNGDWVGISGRARVVVYNTDLVSVEELPNTIEGFTDPAWNGRIGWAPTNGSFQAMVTAMRSVWGEEQTRTWLEGIIANNPIAYGNNTSVVEAVGAGEVAVGFVNHYYLYRFLAEQGESFPARNYFLPGGGPDSLMMVAGAGILQTSPNAENAQKFIEFLLSVPGQQYFTSQTFEYPVIAGVQTSASLPPFEELDAIAIDIDLNAMSDLEGTAALLGELGLLE